MATSKKNTISDAIVTDHREIIGYYDQYLANSGKPDEQGPWARQLIWEVARHSIAEELVVYPLFEQLLGPEGKTLAEADRADHQEVKDRLYRIESIQVGTPDHAALLADIMSHLREHMASEEGSHLPVLEKAISAEDSLGAAMNFERTKKMVPTRSHPGAPAKPPFETLAGLLAAPIDKLKDLFATFPKEEETKKVQKDAKN